MITTPASILTEASNILNETSTDTSSKRISFFNRALRHFCKQFKWTFRLKKGTLTLTAAVSEYNLTTQFTDYDQVAGIFQVIVGGKTVDPVHYDRRADSTTDNRFYLTPDNKTIGFRSEIVGNEVIEVWYWALNANVAASTDTLTVPLPEAVVTPVATFIKHLVHDAKRQRYDARNAILDFQEQVSALKLSEGSNKAKGSPKVINTVFGYTGFKRNYKY